MTDPWSVQSTNEYISQINTVCELKGFEDSFIQDNNFNPIENIDGNKTEVNETDLQHLPDSEIYLQHLEIKLEKLKKSSKLVDALSEKRNDCLRSMLQNNSDTAFNNDLLLELETSIVHSDTAVQSLYRQIQPIQPVTIGETVHIVKYDQLEEHRIEAETNEDPEENLSAIR